MRYAYSAASVYLYFITISIFLHSLTAFGALISVIVDDQDSSIAYASAEWNMGQSCITCDADIDPKQVFGGTWHDATFRDNGQDTPQNMTFNFTGSAIYVYGMQVQLFTRASADVQFFVDGALADTYNFSTESLNDTYKYNQLLFSKTDLGQAPHTLMLVNGRRGEQDSLVLLDYLMYMTDTSSFVATSSNASTASVSTATVTSTSSSAPDCHSQHSFSSGARAAVACLAAILGVVLAACVAAIWKIRRQQRALRSPRPTVDPVQAPSPPNSNSSFVQSAVYSALPVSTQGVLNPNSATGTGSISSDVSRMAQGMRSEYLGNASVGTGVFGSTSRPAYRGMY